MMKTRLLLSLCAASLFLSANSFATDYTLNGSTTVKTWMDVTNNVATTTDDYIRVNGGATLNVNDGVIHDIGNFEHSAGTINISSGGVKAGDIIFGGGGTFNVTVSAGASLEYTAINTNTSSNFNKRFIVGRNGGVGILNIDGTVSTSATVNNTLEIGAGSGSAKGTVNVNAGGKLLGGDTDFTVYVGNSSGGEAALNVAGGEAVLDGSIVLGNQSDITKAELNVTAGGKVTNKNGNLNITVGNNSGVVALMKIDGANSLVSTNGTLSIGANSSTSGTVTVSGGGTLKNTAGGSMNISVGNHSASKGYLNVTGADSLVSTMGNLGVGSIASGNGEVNVSSGGVITNDSAGTLNFNIGAENNSTGVVNVRDGGQIISNAVDGKMFLNIGTKEGSSAILNISGANSLVSVTNRGADATIASIGTAKNSSGIVNISNGGEMRFVQDSSVGTTTVNFGYNTAGEGTSTAKINVQNGGKLLFTSDKNGGNMNFNTYRNSDAGIYVGKGGTLDFVNTVGSATYKIAANNDSGSLFVLDINGGVANVNTVGTASFSINCDNNAGTVKMYVRNGGVFQQTGNGPLNIEVGRNGYGELWVQNGGSIKTGGSISVTARGNSNSKGLMVLDNGTIYGKDGVSRAEHLLVAQQSNSTGEVIMRNNSQAFVQDFSMSNNGNTANAGATSKVTLQGAGTQLKANRYISIGSAASNTGNTANLHIYSGAQLYQNSTSIMTVYDTGVITFNIQGSLIPTSESVAMIYSRALTATHNGAFVIDGSSLNMSWANEGDYSALLFEFSSGALITLGDDVFTVGTDLDADILAAFKDFISIENNTENLGWDDFSEDDLRFENGKLYLGLHAIPEPATWAAMFGALALAIAAYRRRK